MYNVLDTRPQTTYISLRKLFSHGKLADHLPVCTDNTLATWSFYPGWEKPTFDCLTEVHILNMNAENTTQMSAAAETVVYNEIRILKLARTVCIAFLHHRLYIRCEHLLARSERDCDYTYSDISSAVRKVWTTFYRHHILLCSDFSSQSRHMHSYNANADYLCQHVFSSFFFSYVVTVQPTSTTWPQVRCQELCTCQTPAAGRCSRWSLWTWWRMWLRTWSWWRGQGISVFPTMRHAVGTEARLWRRLLPTPEVRAWIISPENYFTKMSANI